MKCARSVAVFDLAQTEHVFFDTDVGGSKGAAICAHWLDSKMVLHFAPVVKPFPVPVDA
jgi:hypothetical protein